MSLDPDHLAALHAVLSLGSFEQAAAKLGVSQPAISLRMRALEDRVGMPLVRRGTPCTGTQAGLRLARHGEEIALMERAALQDLDLAGADGSTRVSLAVNADSLATWFPTVLGAAEGLLLEIQSDDQDHSADWLTRGAVSAAITGTDKAAKGCDVTPLGSIRYIATAAPDFVKTWFSQGVNHETLSKAPVLTYNFKDQLQARWMQAQTGKSLFPPTHLLPSTHGFVRAVHSGAAWGMNPISLVENDLKSGRLIDIAPNTYMDVPHFWQINRRLKPALRALERAVKNAAKQELIPPS